MATELHGEALDRAVAGVLGWVKPSERGRCNVCGWPTDDGSGCLPDNCSMRPPPERRADMPARYSSDWSRLPEMLAWLRERRVVVTAELGMDDGDRVTGHGEYGETYYAEGSELPEDVARLVVAVAEAKDA